MGGLRSPRRGLHYYLMIGSLANHQLTRVACQVKSTPRSIIRTYFDFATIAIRTVMASTRSLTALARARPCNPLTGTVTARHFNPTTTAAFSSSAMRAATPAGPPPQGFRLPRKERWDESKQSALDKAGTFFLMTEMMRGMYVVLEQFFRPP